MEWMTMASWILLNRTKSRKWRVNGRWHRTSLFSWFLGKKLWDETKILSILQAIAEESLNLSGLPRDFESQLTTETPGPLCSFKRCRQWIYFSNCDAKKAALISHNSFPSILSCTSSSLKSHFMSTHHHFPPPLLHNSSWGSFTSSSKFINFTWFPNLLHIKASWDWNSISFLAEGHKTLILIRREGLPESSLGFCSMKCRKIP